MKAPGGAEILVVKGTAEFDGERLDPWSWIRRASGQAIDLAAGDEGLKLWIKAGHLDHVTAPPT